MSRNTSRRLVIILYTPRGYSSQDLPQKHAYHFELAFKAFTYQNIDKAIIQVLK